MYDIEKDLYPSQLYPDYSIICYRYKPANDVDGPRYRSFTTPPLYTRDSVIDSQIRFIKRCQLRGDTLGSVKIFSSSWNYFEEAYQALLDNKEISYSQKLSKLRDMEGTQVRLLYETLEHKMFSLKLHQDWQDRRAKEAKSSETL